MELCFIPAHYTVFFQPLDVGIICAFKEKYKQYMLRRVLEEFDSGKSTEAYFTSANIKNAIIFAKWEWDEVSSENIRNCWRKTKVINYPIVLDDTSNLDAYSEIQSALRKIISNNEVKAEDYIEKNELLFDGCEYDCDQILKIVDDKNGGALNSKFDCHDHSKIEIAGESFSEEIQVPENTKSITKSDVYNGLRVYEAFLLENGITSELTYGLKNSYNFLFPRKDDKKKQKNY